MSKNKNQTDLIKKITLDLFLDWEKCGSSLLFNFLRLAMDFEEGEIGISYWALVNEQKIILTEDGYIKRNFKPKGKKITLLTLCIDAQEITKRAAENKGFITPKDVANLKKDTRTGKKTRRLIWYLVRVNKVVVTWDGKLVLVGQKK